MSRSAQTFQRALERQADQAGKTTAELQAIKAAELGLGEAAQQLIDRVQRVGGTFSAVRTQGVDAFAGIAQAADAAAIQSVNRFKDLIAKIREANAQAASLKTGAVAENTAGTLSDEGLKAKLAAITQVREATIAQLKDSAAAEIAARKIADQQIADANRVAEAEAAAVAKRIVSFDKLRATVAQLNYKQQVSGEQEAASAAKSLADAEETSAARRIAAFQRFARDCRRPARQGDIQRRPEGGGRRRCASDSCQQGRGGTASERRCVRRFAGVRGQCNRQDARRAPRRYRQRNTA